MSPPAATRRKARQSPAPKLRYSIVCRCCGTPYDGSDPESLQEILDHKNCHGDMNEGPGYLTTLTTVTCSHCAFDDYLYAGRPGTLKQRGVVATYLEVDE